MFQDDMAYEDFKNITRKTASDKILRDKAINLDKNSKYDGYHRILASYVYKYLDKKCDSPAQSEPLATRDKSTSGGAVKNENMSNQGFDICFIDVFSKYSWVIPSKDNKDTTVSNAFQKIKWN